jgi:hypothetical protein
MSSLPNTPIHYQGGIIDMGSYNGRVDLVSNPGPEIRNKMMERSWTKNQSTSYHTALQGISERNPLSDVFFSKENIQIIQNGIRAGVYQRSGTYKLVVPPQNLDTLKIIMRSIYLQYAQYDLDDIRGQVQTLNHLVLEYCIPDVLSGAISYQKYLQDQSTLVVPLANPERPDKEWKQLILRQFVDELAVPRPDRMDSATMIQANYVPVGDKGMKTDDADYYKGGDTQPVLPYAKIVYRPLGSDSIPPPYGSLL